MSGSSKINKFVFISEAIEEPEALCKDLQGCFLDAKTSLAAVSEVFNVRLELKNAEDREFTDSVFKMR